MVKKGLKQRAKGLLAGLLVGVGALIPQENIAQSQPDLIDVTSKISGSIAGQTFKAAHYGSSSTDGYETPYDINWSRPPQSSGPKIVTLVQGHELSSDFRPTNSVSKYNCDLRIYTEGANISGTNTLECRVYSNAFSKGFSPLRSYIGDYSVSSNYTGSGQFFSERKNLRDLCSSNDLSYVWQGPQLNILANQTNSQGEVTYGTFTLLCDWNQLVSTKTGNGTNSLDNVIVNYDSNTNVVLNAANDYYVQQYILTRTDNTGVVSVVTNNMAGQTVASTNIAMNNLKGSNALHAVYAPKVTTNGIPYTWLTQYGITNKSDSVETQDGDGDKVTTLDEYFADTNPTNQNSYFQVGSLASGNEIVLGINPSSTGRVYGIDYKTNLMDSTWNSATNNIVGNGSNLLINLNKNADLKFYRANVGLRE